MAGRVLEQVQRSAESWSSGPALSEATRLGGKQRSINQLLDAVFPLNSSGPLPKTTVLNVSAGAGGPKPPAL